MIRNPFNLGKMDYRETEGMVIYRSKMHVSLKRNPQLMPGAAWLRLLFETASVEEVVESDVARGFRARARAS